MIVAGITGSMGMGKTTASKMLRDMGFSVHCSDEVVHELLLHNKEAIALVAKRFPESFVYKKNSIDRKKLKKALGYNHENLDDLEEILHPFVIESQNRFVAKHRALRSKVVFLDIPLLFETDADKRVDKVICVTASKEIQKQRVLARQGMDKEGFGFFLSRQLSDQEKRKRSDFIIQTGNGFGEMRSALKKVVSNL
jgi:dephospho-CoA kinase